jgi:hypothetical protein
MNKQGKITASHFADVMTAGRGSKWGKIARTYAYQVALERLGVEMPEVTGKALEWGQYHEAEAIELYQHTTGNAVGLTDVVQHPQLEYVAGTPDGLIGMDGIIEVKCPYNPVNHMANLRDGEQIEDYWWQIQGYLWITGRQWCDFISYDPRFPERLQLAVHRVYRSEKSISELDERVQDFENELVRPLML